MAGSGSSSAFRRSAFLRRVFTLPASFVALMAVGFGNGAVSDGNNDARAPALSLLKSSLLGETGFFKTSGICLFRGNRTTVLCNGCAARSKDRRSVTAPILNPIAAAVEVVSKLVSVIQ